MTRFFKALLLHPLGREVDRSMSVREAGRKGAAVRNAKQRARILAMAHRLNAEMGRPSDPRLGVM
jgi:hypothetical protein